MSAAWEQRMRKEGKCVKCGIDSKPFRMCEKHRQATSKRHRKYKKRHRTGPAARAYYKKWRLLRKLKGLCSACKAPAVTISYCEKHREKHRLKEYKKRGKFTTTRLESKVKNEDKILGRLKKELGSDFEQVKNFINDHFDLFKDPKDRIIYNSVELNEDLNEDLDEEF